LTLFWAEIIMLYLSLIHGREFFSFSLPISMDVSSNFDTHIRGYRTLKRFCTPCIRIGDKDGLSSSKIDNFYLLKIRAVLEKPIY
jgi:hypothetical protein